MRAFKSLFNIFIPYFRVSFGFSTNVHIILFPYLLYPGKELAMTGSIFMIVAIAIERYNTYYWWYAGDGIKELMHNFRYVAVHHPIDYKQATNDAKAIRRRLAKYLLPVIFSSVLFNIPKFFEGSYGYHYELVGLLLCLNKTYFYLFIHFAGWKWFQPKYCAHKSHRHASASHLFLLCKLEPESGARLHTCSAFDVF